MNLVLLALTFADCIRYPVGINYIEQEHIYSQNGSLKITLNYESSVDVFNNTLYCYLTPDNKQSPTLHLNPGDTLELTLVNNVGNNNNTIGLNVAECGVNQITNTSTNIHFHGTDTLPICNEDEVVKTIIASGQTFTYNLKIPQDESPGTYWLHPHVYGYSETAILGGASSAIIIQGIETIQPAVSEQIQRVIVIRDNLVPGSDDALANASNVPSWDLSMNFIPIPYPNYTPVKMTMHEKEKQFFRVVNAAADSTLNLTLLYDDVAQPLEIVERDGVAIASQDATQQGSLLSEKTILLGPSARVSFIVTAPEKHVKNATLYTLNVDTGPDGDNNPNRPLATISLGVGEGISLTTVPKTNNQSIIRKVDNAPVTVRRLLYFSEVLSDPTDPDSQTNFYITEGNSTPHVYVAGEAPSINTTQGTVEEWVIENRSKELHFFHIHQAHFLLLERNGQPVSIEEQQYLDVVPVDYWQGQGNYSSVTIRLDFKIAGDLMYHCHILGHEDGGMMAMIRVNPQGDGIMGKGSLMTWMIWPIVMSIL